MVCDCQIVMNHYLKVFDKIVDELVVKGLCSVFQKLMKVVFKNFYLVVALQITKFFCSFSKNIYCVLFNHFT